MSDLEDFTDDDDLDLDMNDGCEGNAAARHDAKTITVSRLSRLKELSQRPEDDLSNDQRNEKKRIIRLEKNRRAAAMSRRKKKMYIKNLEERAALMAKHLAILEMENSQLKAILSSQNVNLPPPISNNPYTSLLQSLPQCEDNVVIRLSKKRKLNDDQKSYDDNHCLSIPISSNSGSVATNDSISPQLQQFMPQYSPTTSQDENDTESSLTVPNSENMKWSMPEIITKSEDGVKMSSSLPPPPPLLPLIGHQMPHGSQRLPPSLIPPPQMGSHGVHHSVSNQHSLPHGFSFPHGLPQFLHNIPNNHPLPPVYPLPEGLMHGNLPPFVMPNPNLHNNLPPPVMIKPENVQSSRPMMPPPLVPHNIPSQENDIIEA